MERVQSRALTCLHSILSTMDAESLGGATALQEAAQHLSSLVFGAPGLTLIKLLLQYYSTICYFSILKNATKKREYAFVRMETTNRNYICFFQRFPKMRSF